MSVRSRALPFLFALILLAPAAAYGQIDARMFRFPDVSATRIAFVYAGDIWVVPKSGGMATRLTSAPGEELFPRFSPDGRQVAFSANYDGNLDVYVVPTLGGEPRRLTYHPMDDRVVGWHPDGRRVLVASSRESGRQRYNQFYLVSLDGGMPEKLPVPYGEFAVFSADGGDVAYVPKSRAYRTWKRYRGGWAADIWQFNLKTFASKNLTDNDANDEFPMWYGKTLYFLSDRGTEERANIWALDVDSGRSRQVTHFTDYDITFPAIGGDDIVFQAGGRLYLLDLKTEQSREVTVQVVTDRTTLKPRTEKVSSLLAWAAISPTGKRATFEARGDVFTVPQEHGPVMDLTRTSGVAERYPRWSPDGKTVAYWSDGSGEYELTIRPADGSGAEQAITSLGPGFRYAPYWSPDSTRVAFFDQAMRLRIVDIATKAVTEVDESPYFINYGGLVSLPVGWSADSRWLTWARQVSGTNAAVFVYDTKDGKKTQVTSGYFSDSAPAFDPGGKYLYYESDRSFSPTYSAFDNTWIYANPTRIVAVPLRADVASPLAARNDVEGGDAEKPKDQDTSKDANAKDGAARNDKAAADGKDAKSAEGGAAKKKPTPVTIDLDGFEARAVVLPPKAGRYAELVGVDGKVLYRRLARAGDDPDAKATLVYYDLEEREEKTVLEDVDGVDVSADGKKLLVARNDSFAIVDLKAGVKFEKPLRTSEMEVTVDPRAEWRQMFADAYRFERDMFYDPNMHGVDWAGLRTRYAALIEDAVTRWDVNFVIGEFIAELNSSHTYRGGGDTEHAPTRGVGMLGVDWEHTPQGYRIARILTGAPWDVEARSPLADPGVGVKVGDYVLAVDGVPMDVTKAPWAAFGGLADKTVTLTVNGTPALAGARQVTVKCLDDEVDLRFRDWIEQRRARVDQATSGRVGYIYVQSTGRDAQSELERQFLAQWDKPGLIIDERFNSGGQIPDRFVELLNRPILSYYAVRNGKAWPWPPVAHRGPMVMLINGWSGSGGDAFPFYFREAKVGPLIGTRTWGGLIGISGAPALIDGGGITVPTFGIFSTEGQWIVEGYGVDPDIEVMDDPALLTQGKDPQLDRAIQEVEAAIKKHPPVPTPKPRYPNRAGY
jgi:tricorn protease